MRFAAIAVLVTGCLLAGCRSTPQDRYYTLNMAASGKAQADFGLEVDPIRTSEPLSRRDILIKKTPIEVEYYAVDQWAADPGELVTEKLASEFGHRPEAAKQFRVGGQVLAFEQVDSPDGPQARIKLDLAVRKAEADRLDEPALKKTYELNLPVQGEGPAAVAKALSDGLEQIAAQIVADVAKL
jgi:uncharacterized lipoprotein YmbA